MANSIVYPLVAVFALVAAASIGAPNTAAAQSAPVEIGQLDCQIDPASRQNFIVSSKARIDCIFQSSGSVDEFYVGETGVQFGLDLSQKDEEQLRFIVYSGRAIGSAGEISLDGQYYGAQASVAIGQGVGAFVLIGGSDRQFTLAPLGGTAAIGQGVTAGVGFLTLARAN